MADHPPSSASELRAVQSNITHLGGERLFHETILESFETAPGDPADYDNERQEARRAIQTLERQIAAAKRTKAQLLSQGSREKPAVKMESYQSYPPNGGFNTPNISNMPNSRYSTSSQLPRMPDSRFVGLGQPATRAPNQDPRTPKQEPEQASSRKRTHSNVFSSPSQMQTKSQRASLQEETATRPHVSQTGMPEIIDLTGDDYSVHASVSAQKRRDEELSRQRQQEVNNRRHALALARRSYPAGYGQPFDASSGTVDPRHLSGPPPAANGQLQNPGRWSIPLRTGTTTSMPSAPGQIDLTVENPSPLPYHHGMIQPQIPGAYPTDFSDDLFSDYSSVTPRVDSRRSVHGPQSHQALSLYGVGSSFSGGQPGAPSHNMSWNQNAYNASPFGVRPRYGAPIMGSSSLLDVINRHNNIDFENMTDRFGNPLDQRVTSYMLDVMEDPRKSKEEVENLLKNIRPDMDIPEDDRDGTPEGMRYSLYRHQQLALTWMKRMEEGTNKGGILADDMGLGKTISTLALLLARPSTSDTKTTLIVGPLALIRQWEEEIKSKIKAEHALSVCIYHQVKKTAKELMKYDVVLTTYGTLASDKKKLQAFWDANKGRQVDINNDPILSKQVALLHPKNSKWYRIVLDESQMIKNKDAKTAAAAHALMADYRWCLSGTPMMNGVHELASLYKFLRIGPYDKWTHFRKAFGQLFGKGGDPRHEAMRNVQALLKATMLRRTKTSQIDGKPILDLPPKTEEVIYAVLNDDERQYYGDLERDAQVQVNKYLRKGTLGKHYRNMLVLLLRLRQSCCHPHLLLDVEEAAIPMDDQMLELAKSLAPDVVARIIEKSRIVEESGAEERGFECPICYDLMPDPTIPLPCGHEVCAECLQQHIANADRDNIRSGEEHGIVKCAVCRGRLDPKKLITYTAFKEIHMPDAADSSAEDVEEESEEGDWSDDSTDDEADSLAKGELDNDADKNGNLRGFVVPDGFSSDDEFVDDITKESKKKAPLEKPKSKKKKTKSKEIKASMLKSLRQDAHKNIQAHKAYTKYLSRHWLSSAKVARCMDVLRDIHKTGEKTIIFSQWTMLLDLLQVAIKKEPNFTTKYCRYDGKMSITQRDESASSFKRDPETKIMLVSLRAGNAGLNLVAGSHVIIMDPFWNPYIEMQAVDRAYRIGQKNPVKVYRILVKETVEDRITELQEKKRAMVDAALDEKAGASVASLTLNELMGLFGIRT